MPVTPATQQTYAKKVIAVLDAAPANPQSPTLAELNAATFIQCHIYGDWLASTPEQSVVSGNRKMCSTTTPQLLGTVTYAVNEITYSYLPQEMGTAGAAGNEAIELLTEGTQQWVAEAHGLDGEGTDAFVADDVVNLYHIEWGVQRRGETGDGESAEASVSQSGVLVSGSEPIYDVVVPAT